MEREALKRHCLERLDACSREHPLGHQGKLAARYLVRCGNQKTAEVMFEKGPNTPANLWVASRRVADLIGDPRLDHRVSPASTLFARKDAKGRLVYGRHSALKPMPELGQADLVCCRIEAPSDLERILDGLQL